jgi:hypothetical protein
VDELKTETGVLKLFSKLAQALTDNNNSDVSTPPHFSGKDEEWETWYSQFRTYLKGKGWLDTFESEGPHRGFQPRLQRQDIQQANHLVRERIRTYLCAKRCRI